MKRVQESDSFDSIEQPDFMLKIQYGALFEFKLSSIELY